MSKEEFRDKLKRVQSADLYNVAEYLFDHQGEEVPIEAFYTDLGVGSESVIGFIKQLRHRYKFSIESVNKKGKPPIYVFKGALSEDEAKPKRKSRKKHRDTFSFPTLTPNEKLLNGVFK